MIDRLLLNWGIDPVQFRALLRISLKMDFRVGMFTGSRRKKTVSRFRGPVGMLLFYGVLGLILGLIIIEVPNSYFTGGLIMTLLLISVAAAVLVEFHSVVISPDDYHILSYRPISSRTFFAARLANVLTYTGALTAAMGLFPMLFYTFRYGFAPHVGIAAFLAMQLAAATASLSVIFLYVNLLRIIHPRKLRRVFSYLQLLMSFLVYGSGLMFSSAIKSNMLTDISFSPEIWHLLLPPLWYASLISLADGNVQFVTVLAAFLPPLAFTLALIYAGGKLSLNYSERLASLSESGWTQRAVGRKVTALPLFRVGEARASALLIQNQFRFDQKFRLSVLAIIPLTVLYLIAGLSGGKGLADPFIDPSAHADTAHLLYFAMSFFPVLLLSSLTRSDSFEASWIFFATPSDKGKLVLAMKNMLMIYFLAPYLLALGVIFAFYFSSLLHVIIHTGILLLIAHIILQLLVMTNPYLPFSRPLRKGVRTSAMFGGMLIAIVTTGMIIAFLTFIVYPGTMQIIITVMFLMSITVLLEWLAAGRVRRKAKELEFNH